MTIRAISLCFAALSLACGPTEATTDPEDGTSSTSSTTESSGTTAPIDSEGATTSLDTQGIDETSSDSSGDDDVVEDTSDGSTETGTTVPSDGRYELVGLGAVLEPEGCGAPKDGQPAAWSIELDLPRADGEFAMIETFGPYVSEFVCTLEGDAFTCARETTVDYSRFSGTDAVVHHASSYDVGWDGDDLVGTYTADFTCEGDECTSVLEDWQLVAFPCGLQVPFTGVLAPGQ